MIMATYAAAMVSVESPIDSRSAICSDASRDPHVCVRTTAARMPAGHSYRK
jgi:hypothetical protein